MDGCCCCTFFLVVVLLLVVVDVGFLFLGGVCSARGGERRGEERWVQGV